MLVLSRSRESGVRIGPDIMVKVISIQRGAVKLGIEAPESVRVWRDELSPVLEEDTARPPAEPSSQATGISIVLVVEDDPGHARLIRKALCEQQGTMVTVAETARGALDALGARTTRVDDTVQPDLVLLDLDLPDGSGLEVLRTIRSLPKLSTVPVVVLSCSDDATMIERCMEAGANAFVVKETDYDDFRALLGRIGRFWAGDCLARRPSSRGGDNPSPARSERTAAVAADFDADGKMIGEGGAGRRILLADDDAGHVALIKRALRRLDFNCAVDVVHNGAEAINYLMGVGDSPDQNSTAMPDLVLLDLNMPEMSGRQVLQVLGSVRRRDHVKLPPIVVLTASDCDTDINDSYKLGAQGFIRKPVDHECFGQTVQQTVRYWLHLNQLPSHNATRAQPVGVPR